jgi:hypothetical protein
LVAAAVSVHTPHIQSVAATCWLLLFLLWQLQEQPFEHRIFNILDTWAQVACVFTAYISTTLLEFNASDPTSGATSVKLETWQWAATVLLLTVNLFTVSLLGLLWLRALYKPVHAANQGNSTSLSLQPSSGSKKPSFVTTVGDAAMQANPLRRASVTVSPPVSPQRRVSSVSGQSMNSSANPITPNAPSGSP